MLMSEKEMIRPKKPKIEGNKVKPSDESPSIDLQKEEIISSLYHAKSKINHSLKPLEKDFKPKFTCNNNFGYSTLEVNFIDETQIAPTGWKWDFQDYLKS